MMAIYYVRKTISNELFGNLFCDGSDKHPWHTVRKALSVAKSGDTIYLGHGISVDLTDWPKPIKGLTFIGE